MTTNTKGFRCENDKKIFSLYTLLKTLRTYFSNFLIKILLRRFLPVLSFYVGKCQRLLTDVSYVEFFIK